MLLGALCLATGNTAPAMSRQVENHRSVFDRESLLRQNYYNVLDSTESTEPMGSHSSSSSSWEMPRRALAAPLLETPQCARACSAHAVALDSGASMFLVNSSNVSAIHGPAPANVLLETARGPEHVTQGAWTSFPWVEELQRALSLPARQTAPAWAGW